MVKIENGFRFTIKDISPLLAKYPNLEEPKYKKLLDEWSEECTKHILQTYSAVVKSLSVYAHEFDLAMNTNPELAASYRESEEFHMATVAKDIRENPESTRFRTTPRMW